MKTKKRTPSKTITVNNIEYIKNKKIGKGARAIVFLVEDIITGEKYAARFQRVDKTQVKKDMSKQIWRELDLYNYINTLNSNDVPFFTQYKSFEISKNCNEIKIPLTGYDSSLDKSPYCTKTILEYKGDSTLATYLSKNNGKIPKKIIYSFALQLAYMHIVLYQGNYSHNDFHFDNIMINLTDKVFFKIGTHKVDYCGYQLSAIDYGEVMGRKFKKNKNESDNDTFFEEPKKYLFYEISQAIIKLISNDYLDQVKYHLDDGGREEADTMQIRSKDNVLVNLIYNHPIIWTRLKNKYIRLFPSGKKYIEETEKKPKDELYVYNSNANIEYTLIMERILEEFQIKYPIFYRKYFNFYDPLHKSYNLLGKQSCIDILQCTNTNEILKFFITGQH